MLPLEFPLPFESILPVAETWVLSAVSVISPPRETPPERTSASMVIAALDVRVMFPPMELMASSTVIGPSDSTVMSPLFVLKPTRSLDAPPIATPPLSWKLMSPVVTVASRKLTAT